MPTALPLPDKVSQQSTRTKTYRVLKAQFGDGYSQTAPDGINHTRDSWTVYYVNCDQTRRGVIWTAIDATGGSDYFTWQPHGYPTSLRWKLNSPVDEKPSSGSHYTISFNLIQVY